VSSKALIQRGADVNLRNNFRESPLAIAAKNGNIALVTLCLEKGVEVDAADKHGNTALFYAAQYNRVDICELLLERGANLLVKNQQGKKPLDVATDPRVRKLLEDYVCIFLLGFILEIVHTFICSFHISLFNFILILFFFLKKIMLCDSHCCVSGLRRSHDH
jgi:hypothetical protein